MLPWRMLLSGGLVIRGGVVPDAWLEFAGVTTGMLVMCRLLERDHVGSRHIEV